MKILFIAFFLIGLIFNDMMAQASINRTFDTEDTNDDYLSDELNGINDFNTKTFQDEINFLENNSKNEVNTNDTNAETIDEVSLTHSAIKREPAIVNDDDLKSLLESNQSQMKKRRVRSR